MKNDLIDQLITETRDNKVDWSVSSNPFEFFTYFNRTRYSIEKDINLIDNFAFHINEWDKNGDPVCIDDSFTDSDAQSRLESLYELILNGNLDYKVRYYSYLGKISKELLIQEQNRSVSLYKVMGRLGYESKEERPIIRIHESEDFYYKKEDNDGALFKYVEPPLSQISTVEGKTPLHEAQIVLISAPGATGKTAMAQYISYKLKLPIFDLGKCKAVGANTLTGLLWKQVDEDDTHKLKRGLKSGLCSLILDGLDEASIKVTQEGFDAFLSDVAIYADGAKGLPFVILGRPSVMEDASMVLESYNIKTCLLEIEPFTINKAIDFIDNQMNPNYVQRYDSFYKEVRDYIIIQIGAFFKDESDIYKNNFERFIGYAPVLQSISSLLNERQDFHRLKGDLVQNQKQKIDLLIDIVKRILLRERLKISQEVLPQLFESGRPDEFIKNINNLAGSEEEQCRRILGILLNKEVFYNISNEEYFDKRYNEKMTEWIKSHPFLKGNEKKFQNIVFESYLIAKLIDKPEYKDDVLSYLNLEGSCSYLLLDIYSSLKGEYEVEIDYRFFPYLYSSFKSLDHPHDVGSTEILSVDDSTNPIKCALSFSRDDIEYVFYFNLDDGDILTIPSPISTFNLDAPIHVALKDNKTDFQAPVSIRCTNLSIESKELLLSTPGHDMGGIVWICDRFSATCRDGSVPNLLQRTPENQNKFEIITNTTLIFPFNGYQKKYSEVFVSNQKLLDIHAKLRRTILMFKTNRQGVLLQYSEKINRRIGKSSIGKIIIDRLTKDGVFRLTNDLYYINLERFGEIFGVKYDDIRSSVINDKIINFLQSVYDEQKRGNR